MPPSVTSVVSFVTTKEEPLLQSLARLKVNTNCPPLDPFNVVEGAFIVMRVPGNAVILNSAQEGGVALLILGRIMLRLVLIPCQLTETEPEF